MPLDLTEALERAKLLSDASGLLAQESYDLLVSKLDDTELHAFTMALVDLGIRPRTGAVDRAAQRLLARVLGQAVADEEPGVPDDEIRSVLESAGISVSPDGQVSFYRSNIPGLYMERLPQALPLETAIQVWEQQLEIADAEKAKIDGLQDTLTQLRHQVQERLRTKSSPTISVINTTLANLENYGFSERSVSKTTQGISRGIEQVFDAIMAGNWLAAAPDIEGIQEVLEQYRATQVANYEQNLFVWDALDRLQTLQAEDPPAFRATVEGLGGVVARLLQAQQSLGSSLVLDFGLDWRDIQDMVAKAIDVDDPYFADVCDEVADELEGDSDIPGLILETLGDSRIRDVNFSIGDSGAYVSPNADVPEISGRDLERVKSRLAYVVADLAENLRLSLRDQAEYEHEVRNTY